MRFRLGWFPMLFLAFGVSSIFVPYFPQWRWNSHSRIKNGHAKVPMLHAWQCQGYRAFRLKKRIQGVWIGPRQACLAWAQLPDIWFRVPAARMAAWARARLGGRNPNRPETKLPQQKKTKCMEGDNHIYQSKQDGKHGWNNVRVVRFKSPFLNLWSGPTGDSGITSSTENQFTRENENTSCSYFRCIFCRWWLQQHVSTVLAAGVPKSRMTNVQSPEQVLSTASSVRLGDDSYAERCIVVVVSCN